MLRATSLGTLSWPSVSWLVAKRSSLVHTKVPSWTGVRPVLLGGPGLHMYAVLCVDFMLLCCVLIPIKSTFRRSVESRPDLSSAHRRSFRAHDGWLSMQSLHQMHFLLYLVPGTLYCAACKPAEPLQHHLSSRSEPIRDDQRAVAGEAAAAVPRRQRRRTERSTTEPSPWCQFVHNQEQGTLHPHLAPLGGEWTS